MTPQDIRDQGLQGVGAPAAQDGERWISIPGYEGIYAVSNFGRVTSFHSQKSKLLSLAEDKDGYPIVCCYQGGRRKAFALHRLVCRLFNGEPSAPDLEAAHLDGDRKNARADNLIWATKLENIEHKEGHGTMMRGSLHPLAKLNEANVVDIRSRLSSGESVVRIAQSFGVSHHTVKDIRSGRRWSHVPQDAPQC